jgi:hypothetical protein
MAKPAITKREIKTAALTYAELDQNFQNLADATVSLTADTAGTQVISDLNGNITLVAGTNVTITGNNTAKTITINSSAGGLTDIVNDTTPQLGGDLDVNGKKITNASGDTIEITEDIIVGQTGNLRLGDYATSFRLESKSNIIVGCVGTFGGSIAPAINIDNSGVIIIGTESTVDNKIYVKDTLNIRNYTQTQINNMASPQNGDLVYNQTTHKFQGRADGAWVDLH